MFNVLSSVRTWCLVDIEMKAYIKPNTLSFSIVSSNLIAASKEIGVTTPMGGFYYCSKSGCAAKHGLEWNENSFDCRDLDKNKNALCFLGFPTGMKKVWQYIGCYEYKSNGSGQNCEDFHGTSICEGTQWDLFINSSNKYYVRRCPDKVH